jgi:hypothetical protein
MLVYRKALVFCIWYKTLPGVPTTICGPTLKALIWLFTSMDPIITATFNPIREPSALKWSAIWTTNYLAGARTRPK